MRERLTTTLDLAGLALLDAAAWTVGVPVGLAGAGVGVLLVSWRITRTAPAPPAVDGLVR